MNYFQSLSCQKTFLQSYEKKLKDLKIKEKLITSAPIQSSTLWRLSRPIPAHATSPAIHYKHGWSTHLAGLVNSVSASCWSRLRESAFSESSQRGPSSKTRKGVAPNVCKPCRSSANRLLWLSVLLQHSALRATVVQPHRAPDRLSRQAALAAGLEPAAPGITGGHPVSQHERYEAITTTDSQRQADRAWREHDGEQTQAAVALRGRSTRSDVPQITT